jgi:hypothetical protein
MSVPDGYAKEDSNELDDVFKNMCEWEISDVAFPDEDMAFVCEAYGGDGCDEVAVAETYTFGRTSAASGIHDACDGI